jgi:hypothetical protein
MKDNLAKVFTGSPYTLNNANTYLAFYSNSVSETGSGTDVTATICTTRPDINFTFSGVGTGEAQNQEVTITVLGSATVASVGLWTAASGGELLTFQDLPTPVSVAPGSWTIDAGDIKVKFT